MINKPYKTIFPLLLIMISIGSVFADGTPDSAFNSLFRTDNGGWVAGDATYSIDLPDGRTLWLFGDSFIGTVNEDSSLAPGAKMIRNCAVVQEGSSLSALYKGTFDNPDDFVITTNPDSTWYWPEHGIVENDTLKIIFSEFGTTTGAPGWNFEYRDAWVLLFTFPDIGFIDQMKLPYYEQNGVMYGDRVMPDGGYTYVYGRKEEDPEYHIPDAHIARYSDDIQSGNWEFYDGNNWLPDPQSSSKIMDHPVSQQFGVFAHLDMYVLITQEIWFGKKIYSLVANNPEGPWSNLKTLYETPHPFPDMFTYNAYPHPQFNENNELLISYNSNGDFWTIFDNIELYRPKFIRVPYTDIHYSFDPTGTVENTNNQLNDIIIFPNPADDRITFRVSSSEKKQATLIIFNSQGQSVKTHSARLSIGINDIELYLNDLLPGLYFFSIQDARGRFIHN
jgi:type IX secretion system substrate protein